MNRTSVIAPLIGLIASTAPVFGQDPAGLDDIAIEVHIIGLEVDASTQSQLRQMATAAGGQYYDSGDPAALTGALAAATGVAPVGGDTLRDTEHEPNNRFSTATRIGPDGRVTGRIAPEDDIDWYTFSVPHQGALSLSTSLVPAELDIVFRVWTRNKDVLAGWYQPARVGGETSGVIDLPEPGQYWLEVRDRNDDAFSDSDYALNFVFTATPDIAEPNNRFGDAGALSLPLAQPVLASILPEDDADWYRITVDHQGELAIDITDVPPELDVVYRVWNSKRDVIDNWEAPPRKGGETHGLTDLPAPGDYYLEVRDGNDDARSVAPYSLSARFTATPDPAEPNGRFALATPITPGTPIAAAILPEDDADWYRVTVDHQGALQTELTQVPAEIDIHFRVWTANKDVMTGWYHAAKRGGDLVAVTDLPAAGDYYLEVRDGNDDARSSQPYQMVTRFTATPDSAEPNNHFGQPQAVALNTPLAASILPEDDADWYAVDLPHQGALTVSVTAVPPDLDIVYRLWSSNRDLLTGWLAPLRKGGDSVHVIDVPSPGRWLLELRDGNDDARAVEPYTLSFAFAPTADAAEPNNRFGDATPLTIGTKVAANILPRRDEDWYSLVIAEQGALTVDIADVDDEMDVVFRVWNADKDVMTGWHSPLRHGGPTSAIVDIAQAGVYRLQIADGNHDARSAAPYSLTTQFDATKDATETARDAKTAVDLALGTKMQAAIFPEDDRDWFAVQASGPGVLKVAISDVPPELDIVFRLRDEGGGVISSWHAPLRKGGPTEAEIDLPAAGRYVIEVADSNDDARSTQRYTIQAGMTP